jgi:nucleotide-binding universal stress UspA family protein
MSLEFGNIKNILVPTDGGEQSFHAAEYAISIAKMLGAQVMVVYVIDTIAMNQIAKSTEIEKVEREFKEDGQRYINFIVKMAEKTGIKVASMLTKGAPHEQIVNLAKTLHTDLIVMGTSRHKGADRILIGSVAQQVIEYTNCPVLVVK